MNGIERIAKERDRQANEEGLTRELEDKQRHGELAAAAASYAVTAAFGRTQKVPPIVWPWGASRWKPSDDQVRNLEKAGALIAAEIDRLLRLRESISEQQKGAEVAAAGTSTSAPSGLEIELAITRSQCQALVESLVAMLKDRSSEAASLQARDALALMGIVP